MRLECHNNLWSMFIFGECLCAAGAVAATAQVSTIGEHKVSIGAQLTQPNHAYTLNTWSHVDHTNSYINSNEAEWVVYRTSFWDSLFSTACIAHKNSPSKKRKIVILRTLHICTPYELSNCICAQTVIPCNGETKTERSNGPAQRDKYTKWRARQNTRKMLCFYLFLCLSVTMTSLLNLLNIQSRAHFNDDEIYSICMYSSRWRNTRWSTVTIRTLIYIVNN